MASNLKRSKRTVGKRLTDIQSRVSTIEKRPAAKALGAAAVATANLAPGAVGGWMVDEDSIYAGIKTSSGSYAPVGSLTISSDGHNTANKYRIDTNGDAYFAGVLSAPSGTIGGFTISSSALTGSYSDATTSSVLELGTDAQIKTRYDYTGIMTSNYTEIYLNKVDDEGGITIIGDFSGSVETTRIKSSFVQSRSIFRDNEYSYSDVRLKSNVAPLNADVSTSIIKNLNPVTYVMNNAPDVERHGLIAQDVYEVYPEIVHVGTEDVNDMPWAIDYSRLTVILVSVVKDMISVIEDLEDRVSKIES